MSASFKASGVQRAKVSQFRLLDFSGSDFDVDQFVVDAIGPRLGTAVEGDLLSSDIAAFNPEAILEALLTAKTEIDALRGDADARVRAAADRVDTLSERHAKSVEALRHDADQVLRTVHDLQGTVINMGAKAITMGRHLDKIDQQRRRACDAAQAIKIYEVLLGDDEDAVARTIKSLIPAADGNARAKSTRTTEGRGSEFMDSALMLRKLQAAALGAKGAAAERARERLELGGKMLEDAAIFSFDEAVQRCEAEAQDTPARARAILDMRAAADAMLYYNGGTTMMQRYVMTRKPFIDPDVIIGDRLQEGLTCPHTAVEHVDRLIDEMLVFMEGETRMLPHIFTNDHTVMVLLLQRLCYQRLAPGVEAVFSHLYVLLDAERRVGQAATRDLADLPLLHQESESTSNQILDCMVKIVSSCWRFVASLESGINNSGSFVDKEAREEFCDIVHDILNPYVSNFLPRQLVVLQSRLADVEQDTEETPNSRDFARQPSLSAPRDSSPEGAPTIERAPSGASASSNAAADAGASSASKAGWARPMPWRRRDKALQSDIPSTTVAGKPVVAVSVACVRASVGEVQVAMERVMHIEASSNRCTHRADSALKLLEAYIQAFHAFLYALVQHAADSCPAQLQSECAEIASSRVVHVPQCAFLAVAGAAALHAMLDEFAPVAAAVASDVRATTELSRLLSESDSWIEGAVDLLSTAMVQATVEEAKQRIRKHRQANDYSLSDPPEDAEKAATAATQMQQRARPTREGTQGLQQGIALVHAVATSWLSSGPSPRYGQGAGALASRIPLDPNSTSILSSLAEKLCNIILPYLRKQRYTREGASRLMHDLAALQELARLLHNPHAAQEFENMAQAANVLVLNKENLMFLLDDKAFLAEAVFELQLHLMTLRSDWPLLEKTPLGIKVTKERERLVLALLSLQPPQQHS